MRCSPLLPSLLAAWPAVSRQMLYIIGEPGVGKTTLVKRITKNVPHEVRKVPYVSWTHYSDKVCQLGHDRGVFGGTDALGMAAQKHVLEWLEKCKYRYVLAEGDRLANRKFFAALLEAGWELTVVVLQLEQAELDRRRDVRNARIGKAQDDRWLKTRATKVRNLTAEADLILDAAQPTADLFRELKRFRVVRELRKLRQKPA